MEVVGTPLGTGKEGKKERKRRKTSPKIDKVKGWIGRRGKEDLVRIEK